MWYLSRKIKYWILNYPEYILLILLILIMRNILMVRENLNLYKFKFSLGISFIAPSSLNKEGGLLPWKIRYFSDSVKYIHITYVKSSDEKVLCCNIYFLLPMHTTSYLYSTKHTLGRLTPIGILYLTQPLKWLVTKKFNFL